MPATAMELVNETLLQCHMERAQTFFKDLLQATVVVKASFYLDPSGGPHPCSEQPCVMTEDTDTAYGTLEAELAPVKAWCDLAVLGHAHAPNRKPVPSTIVSIRVGAFERAVRVSGNRTWVRSLGALVPSEPAPFVKIPLRYEHAFGGTARTDAGVRMPFSDNPVGRGYVLLKEDAEGTPLPNIEEIDQPMKSWSDTPLPAGLAPLSRQTTMRGQRGITVNAESKTAIVDASAFCFSHPRMCLPAYLDGAEVELTGVSQKGRMVFRLPDFRYWLRVQLGACRYQLPIVPDTLYLLPEEEKVTVVGRRTFLYQFLPERRRAVHVMSAADDNVVGMLTSIRELRGAPRAELPVEVYQSRYFTTPLDVLVQAHPTLQLLESFPLCPSG
jgi:hypothetical protein